MNIGNCTHMLRCNENRSEALWLGTCRDKILCKLSKDCARKMTAAVKCLPFEELHLTSHSIQCFTSFFFFFFPKEKNSGAA